MSASTAISLCILAKRSLHGFQSLVRSAQGHVDEIVVAVDQGADPGIHGFMASPTTRYFQRALGDDFSAQRNFLFDQARCPWRLILDTDENLPAALWHQLRSIAATTTASIVAFPRRNIILGVSRQYAWPDWQYRLVRAGVRYQGAIHERLDAPDIFYLPLAESNAVIHSKTLAAHHTATRRYMAMRPLTQALLLFEHARPRCLQICLDSLARCVDISNWPIILSIDGSAHLADFAPLFSRVAHVIPWASRAGNLNHVVRSLDFIAAAGYKRVLFMDGDCILRPDALSQLHETPEALFTSLTAIADGATLAPWFCPLGNLITADRLQPLLSWVKAGAYVGLPHPVTHSPMAANESAYDAVFCAYLLARQQKTQFAARSFLGHIGLSGTNHAGTPELEAALFSGDPSTWLDNAAHLFDPVRHPAFRPENFRYRDAL